MTPKFLTFIGVLLIASMAQAEPSRHPFRDTLPYVAVSSTGLGLDHWSSVRFSNHPELGCWEKTLLLRNTDGSYNGKKGMAVNAGIVGGLWLALYAVNKLDMPRPLRWVAKGAHLVAGAHGAKNAIENVRGCR